MENEVKELLSEAREVIAHSRNWTKNAHGRRIAYNGRSVSTKATDKDAYAWDSKGSVIKAFANLQLTNSKVLFTAFEWLDKVSGCNSIVELDDCKNTKHAVVLAVFDKAITN